MKRRTFFQRVLGVFGAAIVADKVVAKSETTVIREDLSWQVTPTVTPTCSYTSTPTVTPSITSTNFPTFTPSKTPSGDRWIDGKFVIGLD